MEKNTNLNLLNPKIYLFLLYLLMTTMLLGSTDNTCSPIYEVQAKQLNIRSQPNTDGEIVGTFMQNTKVCIKTENKDWAETDKGWVSKKYIKLVNTAITKQGNSGSVLGNNSSHKNEDSNWLGRAIVGLIAIIIAGLLFISIFLALAAIVSPIAFVASIVAFWYGELLIGAGLLFVALVGFVVLILKKLSEDDGKSGGTSDGCGGCGE